MWPFKRKKVRQRRLEIRKGIAAREVSRWRRFRQIGGISSLLLAAVFFLGVAVMDLWPPDPLGYREGQYVATDIHARVDFSIPSEEDLQAERQRIINNTPPVFNLNAELVSQITSTLGQLPERLGAATQPADVDKTLAEQFGLEGGEGYEKFTRYAEPPAAEQYRKSIERLGEELALTPIVRESAVAHQRNQRNPRYIVLRRGGQSTRRSVSELVSPKDTDRLQRRADELSELFAPPIRAHVETYLLSVFGSGQPIYSYDDGATQVEIDARLAELMSNPPRDYYQEGQRLVRGAGAPDAEGQGDPELEADELELLRHEHEAFLDAQRDNAPWRYWGRTVGRTLLLLAVVTVLCMYVALYQPRVVENHLRGLALVGLMLLMLGINKGLVIAPGWNPYVSVFPVMMASVILAIAYHRRFAYAIGGLLAVLVALQMRAGLGVLVVLGAAVAVSVFQLREIRTRGKLISMAIVTAAIVFLLTGALGLMWTLPWDFALINSLWAGGFALLAGFIAQGVLPLIERAFGVATSMTLLEWCDASKPLLKRLAMEAPGTYNHSLQLGTMCEAAAEAIGARGLRARVGAYYHDIGKIHKSSYFIENQAGSTSRHAKLSPAMSLLVITGHVKDGLEMAREYGLPRELHEFIATHHGTTLVEYFYHAAAEQRKDDSERAPDEVEFRYPGPKPRSKESAILMLADAAESSVRAMSDPTPTRIENQVHTMVTRRLMDGQLDECNLTLKEVHQIEASLIKSLCGFYHARIAYPTPAGQKPAPAEDSTNGGKGEQGKPDGQPDEESAESGGEPARVENP